MVEETDIKKLAAQFEGELREILAKYSPDHPLAQIGARRPRAWSGPGGAMMSEVEIANVTQTLDNQGAEDYGGRFIIGETIRESAQIVLAHLLGLEWVRNKDDVPRRHDDEKYSDTSMPWSDPDADKRRRERKANYGK